MGLCDKVSANACQNDQIRLVARALDNQQTVLEHHTLYLRLREVLEHPFSTILVCVEPVPNQAMHAQLDGATSSWSAAPRDTSQ